VKFYVGAFYLKNCQENSNLFKIGQKCREIYKTIRSMFSGCRRHKIFIKALLTATCGIRMLEEMCSLWRTN